MNHPNKHPEPWWRQAGGVRFSCTGCGRCCSGDPGAVWLSEGDQDSMARGLGMEREAFVRRYCRLLDGKIALREVRRFDPASNRVEHDCIFLQDGKSCAVYETRPVQCRTFPFWPEALASPEAWQQLRQRGCEGLDQTGEWISAETIASELARTLDAPGFSLPGGGSCTS